MPDLIPQTDHRSLYERWAGAPPAVRVLAKLFGAGTCYAIFQLGLDSMGVKFNFPVATGLAAFGMSGLIYCILQLFTLHRGIKVGVGLIAIVAVAASVWSQSVEKYKDWKYPKSTLVSLPAHVSVQAVAPAPQDIAAVKEPLKITSIKNPKTDEVLFNCEWKPGPILVKANQQLNEFIVRNPEDSQSTGISTETWGVERNWYDYDWVFQCRLVNYSDRALIGVGMALTVKFFSDEEDKHLFTSHVGKIALVDLAPGLTYEFWIASQSRYRVEVVTPKTITTHDGIVNLTKPGDYPNEPLKLLRWNPNDRPIRLPQAEIDRRTTVLRALTKEYGLSRQITPAIAAGTEWPPLDWLNERLTAIGEKWTVVAGANSMSVNFVDKR